MSLYYNNEFWFFDKLKKKKRDPTFELIRKLYVSNIPTEFFSVEQLTKKFRKYGTIESILVGIEKYFVKNCDTDYPNYAYISFKETASAYEALKDKNRKGRPFTVQPANTWKQPIDQFEPSGVDYFGTLNDDCLMELIERARLEDLIELAEVSQRLNSMIHFKIFKKIKEVEIDMCNDPITLRRLRQTLLAHGKYVESVIFSFPEDEDQRVVDRMVDLFTKYIGDSLVKLEIRGVMFSKRMLLQYKKIFQRLKVLKWRGWWAPNDFSGGFYERFPQLPHCSYQEDIDLRSSCGNLEQLTISQAHTFTSNSGAWLRLTKVNLAYNCYYVSNEIHTEFFKNNPQITHLKYSCENVKRVFSDICMYLPNLEVLEMCKLYRKLESEKFRLLLNLQRLRVLMFQNIHSDMINFLLQVIAMLPELEEVELIATEGRDDETDPHLTNLRMFAENASKVKKFKIGNYKLTEDVIIDMLRYSKCLEVFDIRECQVIITQLMLLNMSFARENSMRKNCDPIEVVVDDFVGNELDKFLLNKCISKYIKLIKEKETG